MELRHLRYFVTVAEELHFARAAERLHMTQQPLSFQIKQLEEELGVRLFRRTTRWVELTDAGRVLLPEVYTALAHLQVGVEMARRAERGETGSLVIGYVSVALYNLIPPVVRLFRERFPDVHITLCELCSPELEERLLGETFDVDLVVRGMHIHSRRLSIRFCPHSAIRSKIGFRLSPHDVSEYSTFGGTCL